MAAANDTPRPRSVANHSCNFMPRLLAIHEAKTIATREFLLFTFRYPISGMKTCAEIRRENLLLLIAEYKTIAELNERLGLTRTDATLSQIKNQSGDSKTGKPKSMGDVMARRVEQALGLEAGWMDNDQSPRSYRQQRIEHAMRAMEHMPDYQFDQAIKIIDTLAEPAAPERNGTDH